MAEQKKNFNKTGKKKNQKRDNTPKNFNLNQSKAQVVMNAEGRTYEYKMSPLCARDILKDRKGDDAKKDPQQYLCEYVTEQYGLLGTCIKVLTY